MYGSAGSSPPVATRGAGTQDYEHWFDSEENKVFLAICARRMIRRNGVGAIVWGSLNALVGIALTLYANVLNLAMVALGLAMLWTGVRAIRNPTIAALLHATMMSVALFCWNVLVTWLNATGPDGVFEPRGLIMPLIVAGIFYSHYTKLQHVKDRVSSLEPGRVKATESLGKSISKKKVKKEPTLAQASGGRCRVQLLGNEALFVHRDLTRFFMAPREGVKSAILKPQARWLRMTIRHPLGKAKYSFDRANSNKIKEWLAAPPPEAPVAESVASA